VVGLILDHRLPTAISHQRSVLMSFIRVIVMFAGAAAAGVIATTSTRAQDTPLFRAKSDLVVLHVNVFDGRSDAVPGLLQDSFRVFEDGEPQEIAFFNGADVPVAVGLVLDNSGSMIARQQMVITGGAAFARSSHPEDELFTIHFNENVEFGLPAGYAFTNRETLLQAALSRFRPGGKTALYDAVIAALDHVDTASHQKKVLVVLSDGEDNASRHTEDDMIEHARASDAIIYTVSNANRRTGMDGDPGVLRKLADTTGGVAYFPDNDKEIVEHFDEIAGNIRRGYTIGYVPRNHSDAGDYRRVKVTVHAPGRSNLRVQSRDGYRPSHHPDVR
jgi:Ca-activated chloride channel family protein